MNNTTCKVKRKEGNCTEVKISEPYITLCNFLVLIIYIKHVWTGSFFPVYWFSTLLGFSLTPTCKDLYMYLELVLLGTIYLLVIPLFMPVICLYLSHYSWTPNVKASSLVYCRVYLILACGYLYILCILLMHKWTTSKGKMYFHRQKKTTTKTHRSSKLHLVRVQQSGCVSLVHLLDCRQTLCDLWGEVALHSLH